MRSELTTAIPPAAIDIARHVDELAEASRAHAAEAVRAAIDCGVELFRLRSTLAGAFAPLLRSGELVSIGYASAYRYMQLAERMLSPEELAAALEAPAGSQALIGQTVRALDAEAGKSLTQLYRDYGILGRGKAGGARPGAGRKRVAVSGAEAYEARMGAIHSAMAGFIEAADGFSEAFLSALRDEDRAALRTFFRDILGRIERA